MNKSISALKGNICYSADSRHLTILEPGYVLWEDGICLGVYETLPKEYARVNCIDCKDQLIIPGLSDLHLHAPQYSFRSLGMDMELIQWLNTHAFPEECKYADPDYARRAYQIFVRDLKNSSTTRFCMFATIHKEATLLLMELLEDSGLCGFVGKVNMDRNSPDYLTEESAAASARDTRDWILQAQSRFTNIKPILTPRFVPSCTDELMKQLGELAKTLRLPVQSHLSENLSEIDWVKELCPYAQTYGEAYDFHGLFGGNLPAIMAHCVHSSHREIALMKERNVFVAHCPQSNTNLASGIAPIRTYLEEGLSVGLGTDVAGGYSLSVFRAIADAISCSKLRWRLVDQSLAPLTLEEAFYLATKGGGSFFGKVGSFEPGYEFDALVLDDSFLAHPQPLTVRDRLERIVYLGEDRCVKEKFVRGRKLDLTLGA